jgi:hypothetical protein
MAEPPALASVLTQPQTASEYYSAFSPDLSQKFNNIDEEANYGKYRGLLLDGRTENFVLDFGDEDAWCGVNLDEGDLAALVDAPV